MSRMPGWSPVLVVLSLACSSDDEPTPLAVSSGLPVTESLCAAWQRCGGEVGALFDSLEDCRAFATDCGAFTVEYANSAAEVRACAAAIAAAPCAVVARVGLLPRLGVASRAGLAASAPIGGVEAAAVVELDGCEQLWRAGSGTPWRNGESCERGFCYAFDSWCDGDTSVCEARGGPGDSCSGEYGDEACEIDLTCNADGRCEPAATPTAPALNEACGADEACAGGWVCIGGTCQARRGQGQGCGDHAECLLGYSCVGGQCAAMALCEPLAETGDHCYLPDECVADHWCNSCAFETPGPSCLHGRCDAFLHLGDPCVDGEPWAGQCAPGLICIVDACVPADLPAGEACESGRQCRSGDCVTGICE